VRRFRLPSMSSNEDTFARLVSLAVHDLRTPLATVSGFAKTLQRSTLGDPADTYVAMMITAGAQLAELLEELALAARIESGRWEPNVQEADTRELADEAASRLEAASAGGNGATVRVDRDAATRALHQLARCAQRHGGVDRIELLADGRTIGIAPVVPAAAPIVLREQPRDLGAMIASRVVAALGGGLELDGERLLVRLPE
jgi:signal transduction histidine kinase